MLAFSPFFFCSLLKSLGLSVAVWFFFCFFFYGGLIFLLVIFIYQRSWLVWIGMKLQISWNCFVFIFLKQINNNKITVPVKWKAIFCFNNIKETSFPFYPKCYVVALNLYHLNNFFSLLLLLWSFVLFFCCKTKKKQKIICRLIFQ